MSTVLMGMLAMPVLLELFATGQTIASPDSVGAGRLSELVKGAKEFISSHKLTWLRGTLIGYAIGIAPALGSTTAVWIAYAQAKQSSKNPNEMGKGSPEGIIAPEASRAVCHPADLLTTLVFGIPGSSIMVVLLAAFLMMGVQPGPTLVIEHTQLAFEMLLSIALANILAVIICFFGAPLMVKITTVSPHYLFVYLCPLIVLSTYVAREYAVDVIVIGITALLGLCMRRFGFSAPALILGFVMGDLFEKYMIRSLDLYGAGLFWSSPTAAVITAVIVLSIVWGPAKSQIERMRGRKTATEAEA
jgi:TctA family transporter